MTSSEFTNAPLVVRSLDDAIRAAIELHDLPAPDDARTSNIAGAGCPAPAGGRIGSVDYGPAPQDAICPPYGSVISQSNRSEAREVVRRYRSLGPGDQAGVGGTHRFASSEKTRSPPMRRPQKPTVSMR